MLDAKMTVLSLESESDSSGNITYGWLPYHETWGTYELKQARNIFSAVALGARTVEITLRRQPISLDNSIFRGERQLFITQIDDTATPHFTTLTTALIDPVNCSVEQETFKKNDLNRLISDGIKKTTFPAWMTEKYLGRTQAEPQVVLDTMYVLITPKVVELEAGDLVTVEEKTYKVYIAHTLDDHKNEYEIARKDEA
ncbi:MAG: hypothetical protein CVU91_13405 [Firmicutes bacterium HGW-Firmicutes-16]|nr:MAG: hypothetical protein CVU91_13405 [Firmicutes bacterium HGW-Firmicutes-16]